MRDARVPPARLLGRRLGRLRTDAPEKPAARVRVVPILGGCALEEIYEGANGASGRSLSTYDAARRVWHQTWVSSRGQLLVLEGALSDGRLTLTATETLDGGKTVLWRGVWIPQADGVRETAVTSEDGGKTWTTRFDMLFRKRRS